MHVEGVLDKDYKAKFFLTLLNIGYTYIESKNEEAKYTLLQDLPKAFVILYEIIQDYESGNKIENIPYNTSFLNLLFPNTIEDGLVAKLEKEGEWIPGIPKTKEERRDWKLKLEKILKDKYKTWKILPQKGHLSSNFVVINTDNNDFGMVGNLIATNEEDSNIIPPYHIEGNHYSEDVKQNILDIIRIIKYYFVAKYKVPKKRMEDALHGSVIQWNRSLLSQLPLIYGQSLSFTLATLFLLLLLEH